MDCNVTLELSMTLDQGGDLYCISKQVDTFGVETVKSTFIRIIVGGAKHSALEMSVTIVGLVIFLFSSAYFNVYRMYTFNFLLHHSE